LFAFSGLETDAFRLVPRVAEEEGVGAGVAAAGDDDAELELGYAATGAAAIGCWEGARGAAGATLGKMCGTGAGTGCAESAADSAGKAGA
jgi:hypothetical protein